MADIGAANVRLTADTRQFVQGMAATERSMQRVGQAAQRSIPAVSALGSTLGRASFGRGGAFGSAASGVLSGLGVGVFAGGVGGLAATGLAIGVQELVSSYQRMREEAEKRIQAERELTEQLRTRINDLRGRGADTSLVDALKPFQEAADLAATVVAQAQNRLAEAEKDGFRQFLLRSPYTAGIGALLSSGDRSAGRAAAALREAEAQKRIADQLLADERIRIRGAELAAQPFIPDLRYPEQYGPATDEAVQAANETAQALASIAREQAEANAALLDESRREREAWERTFQRASDTIAVGVNKLAGQLQILIEQRN